MDRREYLHIYKSVDIPFAVDRMAYGRYREDHRMVPPHDYQLRPRITPPYTKNSRKIMTYFTYILRCADGTLYTGYTTDLEKRIETHNSGK